VFLYFQVDRSRARGIPGTVTDAFKFCGTNGNSNINANINANGNANTRAHSIAIILAIRHTDHFTPPHQISILLTYFGPIGGSLNPTIVDAYRRRDWSCCCHNDLHTCHC
jgi:hypothetical protein